MIKTSIYGYVTEDEYSFLKDLRDKIKDDGYSMSISKLLRFEINELENTNYAVIKEKLLKYEMI